MPSEPRVRVRDAQRTDGESIRFVLASAFLPFNIKFSPTALTWTPPIIQRRAREWIVAAIDSGPGEQVVGVVHYLDEDLGFTFDALGVAAPWQRRGVGRALVMACEGKAVSAHREHVTIILRESLSTTVRFFELCGYRRLRDYNTTHAVYRKEIA